MKVTIGEMVEPHCYISPARLGALAIQSGWGHLKHADMANIGIEIGSRLGAVGMARWGGNPRVEDIYFPAGAPQNQEQMRELLGALSAVERMQEDELLPEFVPLEVASGEVLDRHALIVDGMERFDGESDVDFRERLTQARSNNYASSK